MYDSVGSETMHALIVIMVTLLLVDVVHAVFNPYTVESVYDGHCVRQPPYYYINAAA